MVEISALAAKIRAIADFPEPGVTFRDITPLLAEDFHAMVDALVEAVQWPAVDAFIGVEARGFLLAAPLADRFNVGFVPVRKAGKLPADVVSREYSLEYGSASLEMHVDALPPGARVVIVDDVLATGGTLEAAAALVESVGAEVLGHLVLIEVAGLGGRERVAPTDVVSVLRY
jgi:adenine phosphoribosyltransferase